jgi:hypothetical protein
MRLLGILLAAVGCGAELFPISDTAYPHIFITDPATIPVVWHRKVFAFR